MTQSLRGMAAGALALSLLLAQATAALADGVPDFELITPAEAQQELRAAAEAQPALRMRAMPSLRTSAPAIRVVAPDVAAASVPAPLRIELAFQPAPGTHIVPSTFRVLYGLLKIDLTERLRKHATVTESGVIVEQAQVPDGQHRLILQVGDDQGHTAEQELLIRVGAAS